MRREFEITFGFWRNKILHWFEIDDLDECVTYVTRTKIISADNKEGAERKLKHRWASNVDIKQIKEITKEKTL